MFSDTSLLIILAGSAGLAGYCIGFLACYFLLVKRAQKAELIAREQARWSA